MNTKYTKGLILLSIIGSIGLSSCQITNKYKAPEIDSAKLYRDINATDTTSIASLSWKSLFTDPYLQALIDEGLANNQDMLVVLKRVEQAQAALGMARAAYFPTVGIGGQVTHNRLSAVADPKDPSGKTQLGDTKFLGYDQTSYQLGLVATWELDIWGKLNRQSRAKYAQYLNSEEGRNLAQTNLVSGIAVMYYNLLAFDEQLKASLEAIDLLKETVVTMEAMKEAGMLNAAAVEQTKAALYNTQINIPNLEKGINELENNLCLMLGKKSAPIARGQFASQAIAKEFSVGTPAQMLANRPDVRSAELAFRSAFEMTNVARASFYPSITLNSGMLGFVSMLDSFFKPENLALSLVGGITQPLFAKKQLTTQLKVAKADQEIALISFQKAVLNAGNEVSNIMYGYQSSMKKNEFRDKQIESLTKSVEYTQLLLKAGEANYLEVITAEQDLLQAQIGKVNDKLEQLTYSANLYKALGGGVR